MKNFILFFLMIPCLAIAQGGNLQYAETKLIRLQNPLSIDGVVDSEVIEIPEGQTWKIESAHASYKVDGASSDSYDFSIYLKLLLDDQLFWVNSTSFVNSFPIWLPPGSYTLTLWSDSTWSNTYSGNASVSILVFNIVE